MAASSSSRSSSSSSSSSSSNRRSSSRRGGGGGGRRAGGFRQRGRNDSGIPPRGSRRRPANGRGAQVTPGRQPFLPPTKNTNERTRSPAVVSLLYLWQAASYFVPARTSTPLGRAARQPALHSGRQRRQWPAGRGTAQVRTEPRLRVQMACARRWTGHGKCKKYSNGPEMRQEKDVGMPSTVPSAATTSIKTCHGRAASPHVSTPCPAAAFHSKPRRSSRKNAPSIAEGRDCRQQLSFALLNSPALTNMPHSHAHRPPPAEGSAEFFQALHRVKHR